MSLVDEEELEFGDDEEKTPPATREFIDDLVDKTVLFMHELVGFELYPYQVEVARRIIESVITNDGEEITILMSRQSGKSETVADVVAALLVLLPKLAELFPELLGKFKKGFWVGIFAPTDEQADTIFSRAVTRLTSEHAMDILLDPEIDETPDGKGKIIRLKKSGSFCRMQTAHPRAKIESKSYHLLIVDEAQHADEHVVRKSIHPMGAFYNASVVKLGTPDVKKGDFYRAIQLNKRRQTRRGMRQNHFEFDWKTCARYNPNYRKYVTKEMRRLGEDSDEFRLCVAPETKVLTADLRYIAASELTAGMRLVGFDEFSEAKGQHRKFRETVVEAISTITRPSYRLDMDDGTSIVCSAEHLWLVTTAGRRTVWKTTEQMTSSDRIFKVADVWDTQTSYEAGYLAAAFDGEGCVSTTGHRTQQLVFSQKSNPMLQRVEKLLGDFGYSYGIAAKENGCNSLYVKGGRASVMQFLGEFRPPRLLERFDIEALGSIGRHDHVDHDFRHPTVVKKTFLGEQEVIAFRTSTRTFVAEGLASHNSYALEWLLERGMFVTSSVMEELSDTSMDLVRAWFKSPVLVGIDPARRIDSTVVTVVWVDWDRPDEFGFFEHRILNWLELHGDDWEEQYFQVCQFLEPYDVLGVGVDSQGVGDAVAQRLAILLPRSEVHAMGSNRNDQSERWKHLMELIQRRMIAWPASAKTRRTKVWRRFMVQMEQLEKHYEGPHLLARAPEEAEAHDDYPDSLALACSLTRQLVMPQVEVSSAPFYEERRRRYS